MVMYASSLPQSARAFFAISMAEVMQASRYPGSGYFKRFAPKVLAFMMSDPAFRYPQYRS